MSLGRDGDDVTEESQVNVLCWLLPPVLLNVAARLNVEVAARTATAHCLFLWFSKVLLH